MTTRHVGTSLYAGLLFTVLGALAWASGQPFVFPSLGPSAFLLAFDSHSERTRSYSVVGSHAIGALAGFWPTVCSLKASSSRRRRRPVRLMASGWPQAASSLSSPPAGE